MALSALILFCLLAVGLPSPAAAGALRALDGLGAVGVDVELDVSHEAMAPERLARRIQARLTDGAPRLTVDPAARDRLRLAVAVQPHGATELRGFWLPFSGTYGIGPVRLSLERVVTLVGGTEPIRASVWHVERQAAGPWRESPAEILKLLDANVADFLSAYLAR
jgi:hypothetical protein